MDSNQYPPSYQTPGYEPPPALPEQAPDYGYPAPNTYPNTYQGAYPGYPAAVPVAPHTSTLAIVSLVASLLGVFPLSFLGSIVGVICGHLAISEIKKSNGMVEGQGLAVGGLVTGYITLGLGLICCLFFFVLIASSGPQQ